VADRDLRPVHAALFPHRPYAKFRNYFQRVLTKQQKGLCFWLIVESEAHIVGSGQLVIYPHGAELANLVVGSSFRNLGVGTAIIRILTDIATHVGLKSLEIGVVDGNDRALTLYQRLGFAEDRQLRLDGSKAAIILRKSL
jgi:GNAT superfamily N-acetyltransferase